MIDLSSTVVQVLIVLVLAILVHAAICARLFQLTEALRDDLAHRGERLLVDSRLSDQQRQFVSFMLDNAYNGWFVPFMAVALPVWAVVELVRGIVRTLSHRPRETFFDGIKDPELIFECRYLTVAFGASLAALSPVSALVVLVELLLFSLLGLSLKHAVRSLGIIAAGIQTTIHGWAWPHSRHRS